MSLYDPRRRATRPAARLAMAVLRLAGAVKTLAQEDSSGAGLTPAQAQTLLFARHTKPFARTIGTLARHLGATHATAVGVADGLIARGLLRKDPNPRDRRSSVLRLTEQGEATCRRLEQWGHALEESVARLPAADQAALERVLGSLVWSLRAAGRLQVAEPCRGCTYFAENARPGTAEPHACRLIDAYLSEEDSLLDCPDHLPAAGADRVYSGAATEPT